MANSITLEIITPSKLFYKNEVKLVIARTLEGDEGFMSKHTWATKLLDIGELWIQEVGAKEFRVAAVSEGFIDVQDKIVIFTDAAEWSEDIDVERAISEKTKAEDWLTEHGKDDPLNVHTAKIMINKSLVRMNVSEGGQRKRRVP
ncbi:MAG: ATP synthase F1 subunit epsilon [Anaerovoracaceae bacterium]